MKATWNGVTLAESDDTVVVEGNHYFPEASLNRAYTTFSNHRSGCPWKGQAHYYSLMVDGSLNENAVWYYPEPKEAAKEDQGPRRVLEGREGRLNAAGRARNFLRRASSNRASHRRTNPSHATRSRSCRRHSLGPGRSPGPTDLQPEGRHRGLARRCRRCAGPVCRCQGTRRGRTGCVAGRCCSRVRSLRRAAVSQRRGGA